MSWAELFHWLWEEDWSSPQIAEAYGVPEERVRILVSAMIVKRCDEIGIAI